MLIIPSPDGRVPAADTPLGDQVKDAFLARLGDILGDVRLQLLYDGGDTTSTTEHSRHARVFTHDATTAARLSALGSGLQCDFDGDDDEADTPDVANLSFGDGSVDQPFSVLWLGTPDTDTSAQTLVSKQNSATVDEWELHLTATNGYPTLDLIDASSSGIIGRSHDTAIGTSIVFIVATYDGSRSASGIRIYKDAARVDDGVGGSTGAYTAMENTASLVRLGNRYTTPERFYNGKKAMVAVVAKELTVNEVWAVKTLINSFFDQTL